MLAKVEARNSLRFVIGRTALGAVLLFAAACAGDFVDVDGDGDGDPGGDTVIPPGGAGPDGPVAASCEPGDGALYEVGPGQEYEAISDVPWEEVDAGATVRIHWRAEPYAEKIAVNGQGTEESPIRVCGVAGPNGELPLITGVDAHTRPGMDFSHPTIEDLGIVVIARPGYDESPRHIIIEGLHVTGAYDAYSYTDSTGNQRTYSPAAACIRVQEGDHITIRANMLTDCGNGLMALSNQENAQKLTTEMLIEGNYLQDNGIVGSDRQHNSYVQAIGATYQYNYFGRPREGSLGVNLKDRSAGLVIRYNWVEGGKRVLDIVDAEDFGAFVIEDAYNEFLYGEPPDPEVLETVRTNEERYRTTHVYGNFLRSVGSTDTGLIVHYGHDTVPRYTRKGTLWFYNNTVLMLIDQSNVWKVRLMDLSTDEETAEVFNNIVHIEAENPGAVPGGLFLTRYAGLVNFGTNWITSDWEIGDGNVAGTDNLLGGTDSPIDHETMLPLAGSEVIDASEEMASELPPVSHQYEPPTSGTDRPVMGGGMDLGAAEVE